MIGLKDVMAIEHIDDWEMRLKRQDAVWRNEILDRPFIAITFFQPNPDYPFPDAQHASPEVWWLDVEYQAELALAMVMNTAWVGDALPNAAPNLGPDFFAACYGGRLIFKGETSYIVPFLQSWDEADGLQFNREHPYFLKMEAMYKAFLEIGRHRFYTGWPDIHAGGDCLVGFRGPAQLAMDLIEAPAAVKACLEKVTADFLRLYDHYYAKLTTAGQACTGWPGIVSTQRWHVPSNDFSYMISPAHFKAFFLEGLREENRHMEANLHHLDGPGCRNHLESLLGIEELNMIQWVQGAGRGRASDYIPLYKQIQAAGKGIQLQEVAPDEVEILVRELRPEGVWMQVMADNAAQAQDILRQVRAWR